VNETLFDMIMDLLAAFINYGEIAEFNIFFFITK